MEIMQKAKHFWKNLAENRWLIGRRLVLHFKNAENPQVLVMRFPMADRITFDVAEETDSGRVWFSLRMRADAHPAETLARFQSRDEALLAMGKIRGRVAWGAARIIKSLLLALIALVVLNGAASLIFGMVSSSTNPVAAPGLAPSASSPFGRQPGASGATMGQAESDRLMQEMLRAAQQAPLGAVPQQQAPAPEAPAAGDSAVLEALKNAQ